MFPSSWLRYNIVLQIKDDMKSRILRILDTTYRGLVQNYRDNLPFHLYLGVGKAVNELNDLRISMVTACVFHEAEDYGRGQPDVCGGHSSTGG